MTTKWIMKALVQKGISILPKKEKINYFFQKHVTHGVNLTDSYFENKIIHASDHIKFFKKHTSKNFNECSLMELGTGWYPIIPIALFLNEIKCVISVDILPWMTKENQILTIKKFVEWNDQNRLETY